MAIFEPQAVPNANTVNLSKEIDRWVRKNKNIVLNPKLLGAYLDKVLESSAVFWQPGWVSVLVDGTEHELDDFLEEVFLQFTAIEGSIIGHDRDHETWGRSRPDFDETKKKMFQLLFRFLKANAGRKYSTDQLAQELDLTTGLDPLTQKKLIKAKIKKVRENIRRIKKHYPKCKSAMADKRMMVWFEK